ncbi:MAG: hypothetical protein P1U53_04740 [Sulfitobacter sp.]|nr:hypothetical protein [Sulfitobacter sp.]
MGKRTVLILLVLIWAGVFFGSFYATSMINGPRNIDTGFRRLDVLARYHIIALGLALVTAALGFVWRGQARQTVLIGLVPMIGTVLTIGGIAVAAMILGNRAVPVEPDPPRPVTAPAMDVPVQPQD